MKNFIKNTLLISILFLLISCSGVRSTSKTNWNAKEETKVTEASIDTSKTEKVAVKEENVVKNTEVTETEEEITTTVKLTPLDSTKPAKIIDAVGNVVELNNLEQTTTTKKSKKNKNQKENLNQTKKENSKETDNKGLSAGRTAEAKKDNSGSHNESWRLNFSLWWLLLLLIPVAAYCYYKKFGWNLPVFNKKE